MAYQTVQFPGTSITEKETHYEARPFLGPFQTTVVITAEIAQAFQKKWGFSITKAGGLSVRAYFGRNDEKEKECQNVFLQESHISGTIESIDDITAIPVKFP